MNIRILQNNHRLPIRHLDPQQSLEEKTQIKLLRNMQGWNKKRKAMRHYDQLAQIYDTQYAEEQNAKIKAALDSTKLDQNGLVLDMGCGTGLLFQHVANSTRLLVGVDISSKILKITKKRAKQVPNIAILRADADYIPFQNQTFDHVFAITLMQNMPEPLETLQEIERVGKLESAIILTGLKKKFSQRAFTRLLNKARLEISTLKTSPQLRGYLAICKTRKT